jgi:hypothetical protein
MTSITQKIPNFVGGISQQPDELFNTGSVKDLVNGIPDIKGILSKRPGSKLVDTLSSDVEGTWHHYFRDSNEQYFMRVRYDGQVDIWDALTGKPRLVRYSNNPVDFDGLSNSEPDGYYQTTWSDHTTPPDVLTITGISTTDQANDFFWVWSGNTPDTASETLTGTSWGDAEGAAVFNGDRIFFYHRVTDAGVTETGFTVEKIRGALPVCLACDITGFKAAQDNLYAADAALTQIGVDIEKVELDLQDTTLTAQEIADLELKKSQLEAQIPSAVSTYNSALATYGPFAEDCGVFAGGYSTDSARTCSTTNLVPYLAHEEDHELQLTTINDYTFVTNREVVTNMDSGSTEGSGSVDYPYEAFLYLNQLQADTVYTVRWWDEDDTVVTSTYRQASALALRSSTQLSATACGAATYNQVHTDTASGITFRLTVTRQSILEAEPDGGDDYDCQWQASVSLIATDPSIDSGTSTPDISISALGRTWNIYVSADREYTTTADYTITAGPYVTGTDQLNAETILQDLLGSVESYDNTVSPTAYTAGTGFLALNTVDDPDTAEDETDTLIQAEIIGNGIFLRSREPFVIDTPGTQLITVINGEVNNASLLPTQCKDGYVVKVNNSFTEEDDYYVKFVSKLSADSSAGVWEETVKPGLLTRFDYNTMPHQIRRLSDGTFEVAPIDWANREVGDDVTNPKPSFVGDKINKTMFFRNRFVFLSGENVIMSRPNEYFNVWAFTAQTVSDADPIDLLASSTFPSILYDGLSTSAGLLVMSNNQQFLVVTDTTDVFSPRTAMIKNIGQYKYNTKVRPVHMGQTVGFLNDAGYRSRFFELIPSRDFDYQAVETSKPVDQLIPSDISLIADSKDDNMLALTVKQDLSGTVEEGAENPTLTFKDDSRFVWIYRYFTQGDRRIQSAWFKWKLTGHILYHAIMDDKYYAVLVIATGDTTTPYVVTLQSFDLKIDRQSYLINVTSDDMRDYDYQVHMDNYTMILPSAMTYDSVTDTTSWRLPLGFNGPETVVAYELELQANLGYNASGRYAELTTEYVTNGIDATAPGDWTNNHVLCGYNFEFLVQMPTIYPTKQISQDSVRADTRGSLILHRCHFNFDSTGVCEFTVNRKGRDPYTVQLEQTIQDGYVADHPAVETNAEHTVPLYDRNTNVDITLKSKYPTPTNLISADWEGDYNPKFYKRV